MILYDSTLITPTTGLMIWTLVTFVIVLLVLRRFAFGPIQAMIETRRQAITADLDAAQGARDEAQQALAEYREQLAEARKEASKIVDDARRVADERRAAAVAELEAEKARLMRQTQEEIQAETRQALNAIKQQVADLAVAATEKVVRARLDVAEQRRLIDEALADVDLSTLVPPAPEPAAEAD
jgi:F-type H+-transporting ATPase subunit b